MNIALIPARAGSKRIPKKNIRYFCGSPLISYAIKAAIDSKIFDRVIVTTDSGEIAKISREFGAETPFIRPLELYDDFTPTISVIKHAVQWLKDNDCNIKYCCCIYSNPFVTAKNIRKAYDLLVNNNATSVIPVTTFPFSIFRSSRINEKGLLEFNFPESSLNRSQDLEESYHDAGQFYWWDVDRLMSVHNLSSLQCDNRFPLVLPRYQVQDIDTLEDLDIAINLKL